MQNLPDPCPSTDVHVHTQLHVCGYYDAALIQCSQWWSVSAVLIRGLHTEEGGHLFPVCSNFTDNELVDVFQCGVRVNAEVGGCVCGG